MKKILFIALLIIPFYGFSQSRKAIDGFLGIKFGSDTSAVKSEMLAMGAIFNPKTSDANHMGFTNVEIESKKHLYLYVKFVNNKAYEADFAFMDEPLDKPVEFYNGLVKVFNEEYGMGLVARNFSPPYSSGDGKEIEAIKSGNAQFNTVWADEKNNNAIKAMIDPSLNVYLIIQNAALYALAEKKH